MEWCKQNGAVFNDETFYMAADQCAGIQVLGWLKLNDCPWGVLSLELFKPMDL